LAPRDPRTLTLTGLALAQCHDLQAKRPLKKALQMSPALARPLFCLVDLYKQESQYDACLEILNQALSACATSSSANIAKLDAILCAIGDVYTATERYESALDAYNRALATNPNNSTAKDSLEQLEKVIKGLDPNENSDDIIEDPVPDGTNSGNP
jgi:tetratricopeptide (TPR) repeat protein